MFKPGGFPGEFANLSLNDYRTRLTVKDKRPVNLDLTAFKWPLPALTSITHRITGVVLFFGTAVLLYLMQLSLESEAGFQQVTEYLAMPLVKFVVWAIVAGLLYHLIAGVKHLIMDFGIGETLQGGKTGAVLTIVISAIAIVISGVWIW